MTHMFKLTNMLPPVVGVSSKSASWHLIKESVLNPSGLLQNRYIESYSVPNYNSTVNLVYSFYDEELSK